MASLLTITALLGLTFAQTTTITIPWLDDVFPLQASVVSAKPSATVLALACPPGTDSNDCGLFPQQLLTYGPTTYLIDMSQPGDDDFSATMDCSISATKAMCKESASGSEANFPGSSTETYDEVTTIAVTITAGAEKLTASGEATTEASPSPTGGSSVAASTGAAANSTFATSMQTGASGSGSSSGPPAEHTGAAVRNMASDFGLVGAAAGLVAGIFI